ncbi:STIP1 y and U box-containing protein 1 [Boothiomyces sp. JEL0866]|nr:STIP1 y and U box-containing protein 1 [Boothiomyces sp. JEL0866]
MSALAKITLVSQGSALQLTLFMGGLYHAEIEKFVTGKHPPKDPLAIAKACYVAAFIYMGLFAFGLCQNQALCWFAKEIPFSKMSAELHKQKGNEHFASGNYEEAIKEYTTAIIHNPAEPKYFSNRAIAHFKFDNYEQCTSDCQRALELDPHSYAEALLITYDLAVKDNIYTSIGMSITASIRTALKKKWEQEDIERRLNESETFEYFYNLIQQDSSDDKQKRLDELDLLFANSKVGEKRHIHFEIMVDPVVTPSGMSFDRVEILQHLQNIGKFDPISRQYLDESMLIPNYALKATIDEFLSKNGWAVDH